MTTADSFQQQLQFLQTRFDAMQPELEVTVRDPALDVEGHIVVWNTGISKQGPLANCAKGGTRIRSDLSRDEIGMLARNMAIKNAAAGLPLGGCKSGLKANPKAPGFEQQYRRFIELCKPYTRENGGIFGGFGFDIGAAPEHALWACETLGTTRSFTGKTVAMGGTDYDQEGIAGLGVAEAAARLIELNNKTPLSMRFAVHGLGAMGAAVVRYFSHYGAQVAAIGDPKYGGSWRFEEGISTALTQALTQQQVETAQALLIEEGTLISEDANAVLFENTDVLFPCALQYVITPQNVSRIKASYIVEGANNPTELGAYNLLHQQGVQQVPDFIANSGGIIAAFIELTSDVSDEDNIRNRTKVQQAKELTRSKIRANVSRILALSQQQNVSLREAGLHVALTAILDT
jgi:glutamate dehydrogenase (NAD(P)+)